ncbi:MAG: DNA-binding protein [Clostridia bacterium]|nr:DNA-binding protein [Clostridia bacterium]MBR4185938.1 DNA-binding protein [Clostridia bacterium]
MKDMRFPLLLDAYGALLTERKRELLDYYYNEDYSLSEIAELTGLSRQGVRDGIKKAEEELYTLEETLSLVSMTEAVSEIAGTLAALAEKTTDEDAARDIREAARRLAALRQSDPT